MYTDLNCATESQTTKASINSLFFHYIIVVAMSFSISSLLFQIIRPSHIILFHTVLELICIFIATSLFLIIWYTHDANPIVNRIIGFGFFVITIFILLHICFYLYSIENIDISTKYGVASRFTEAVMILLVTQKQFNKIDTNKWRSLSFAILYIIGVNFSIVYFSSLFPLFLKNNLNYIEISVECFTILFLLISLYRLHKNVDSKNTITYRCVFFALLCALPVNICFAFFRSSSLFYYIFAHVLRVVTYYYMFKGIFISGIIYPHQKIKECNNYLTTILDKLPIAFASYTSDYKSTYANRKTLEILGYDLDDIKDLSAQQIIDKFHLEETQIRQAFIKQVDETSDIMKNKLLTIVNKQGKRIKVRVDIHKLDNGEVLCLFEEATKEQELENLQLQTKMILNSISNTVILADNNGKIVMCNKPAQEILEMDEHTILGMNISELDEVIRLSHKGQTLDALKGKEFNSNVSLISKGGNRKEILLYSAPIINVEKKIIGIINVGTDITNLKDEQERVIQQEKLALLGQLSAGIIHEAKNFLTIIKGSSQLLNLIATDDKTKKYALKIDHAVNEVNIIISGFLSLAKPKQPVFVESSLNDLILTIKSMLESSSLIKGVDIEINLSSKDKQVLLDESQIKQVILNISKNAIEAMSEIKNPLLSIQTEVDEIKNEIFIRITDNGKGISEKEIQKLGTPFFTTKEKGTGLGLNTCFEIVKEHGGRIDIESELGKGTSFIISLPIIELENDDTFDQVCMPIIS